MNLKPCGTRAAFFRHKQRGEVPCQLCKDADRAYMREWVKTPAGTKWEARRRPNAPANRRRYHLEQYGLTPEEFASLSLAQGGVCAICHKAKPLCVDHDHYTGVVRGLLCAGCNTGLGKLGDNIAGLQRAIDYLRR